jgi:hypothetical protein
MPSVEITSAPFGIGTVATVPTAVILSPSTITTLFGTGLPP